MSNKCGGCQLFQGPREKCGGGLGGRSASSSAPSNCFKGPASLFSSKKCGGCRLFQGPREKCGGGLGGRSSSSSAPSNCYSPIPG